jgi:hypothetical protein
MYVRNFNVNATGCLNTTLLSEDYILCVSNSETITRMSEDF